MSGTDDDDDDDDVIPGRHYGVYVCSEGTDDEHEFVSWNPKQKKRKCKRHPGEYAIRIEYRKLRKSDIPDDYRLFGRFTCDKCKKNWGSANTWKGHYQKCKGCNNKVCSWNLNFLRGNGGENNKNGHLIDKCGKCKDLKRKGIADNCLVYRGRGRAASRPGSRYGSTISLNRF